MTNSPAKGKSGELEWVSWLKKNLGINARRGRQFKGTPDSPDVISDLESIHWEVKRVEKLNLEKAMAKAVEDASPEQIPVVAHRRNRAEWHITVQAKDLISLAEQINGAVNGIRS